MNHTVTLENELEFIPCDEKHTGKTGQFDQLFPTCVREGPALLAYGGEVSAAEASSPADGLVWRCWTNRTSSWFLTSSFCYRGRSNDIVLTIHSLLEKSTGNNQGLKKRMGNCEQQREW